MASSFKIEIEMKTPAEKVWSNIKDLPKLLLHLYEKVDVLEGDGKTVGSVLFLSLKPGSKFISTIKERIELMDEEKKTVRYSFIGGDVMKYFKSYKGTSSVYCKNGETLLVYSAEYENGNEEFPHPDFFKDYVVKLIHDLDVEFLNIK